MQKKSEHHRLPVKNVILHSRSTSLEPESKRGHSSCKVRDRERYQEYHNTSPTSENSFPNKNTGILLAKRKSDEVEELLMMTEGDMSRIAGSTMLTDDVAFVPPPPPPPPQCQPKPAAADTRAQRRRAQAIVVDRFSRIIFPVTFGLMNMLYWVIFWKVL